MNTIGNRIREYRIGKKLEQKQLASLIGVARVTISQYENNARKPTFDNMIKLSRVFGISLDEICGLETTKTIDVSMLNEKQIEAVTLFIECLKESGNERNHR